MEPEGREMPSIKTCRKTDDVRKLDEDEEEEPLSPGGRVLQDPRFNCCIMATMGIGKSLDVEGVKEGLMATLARHPRFSSIAVKEEIDGKKPRWIRTKVEIDDHIIIPDIEKPTSVASADKLVEDYMAKLSTTLMDYSRPLWELHLLNFPTSTATAVAIFKLHHSLGDGISLVSLLLACTRKASDPKSLPTLPQISLNLAPNNSKLSFSTFFVWLWALLILVWNTFVDVLAFTATSAFLKDSSTALKGSKGVGFRSKRFVHRSFSLDDIKDIKNAMHCTINDVLLGVTSAALSAYLSRKYGESEDHTTGKKKKQLPDNLRFRSTVLVNVRPSPGLQALSDLMEGKKTGIKWGNLIGYVILPFTIKNCKDPIEYIVRSKAIADRKKKSLEAIFTYWSTTWILKIFGVKTASLLANKVLSNTTFSFSNIPGPIEEIEFYGHPLVYLAPSVYGHPHALTIHCQSYMNKMTISLAVDELTVPDPHQLLDEFLNSLKLIKDAIPAKS